MEHALPALKTKRKKRKPPHGRFWWYLGNLTYCMVFGVWNLMNTFDTDPTWVNAISLACAFLLLYLAFSFWWPLFKKELNKWHKDNEE